MDDTTRRRGRRSAAAVVVVGLVATVAVTWWIASAETRASADRLEARADRAVFVLRTQVDRYVAAGAAVSAALSRDPLMGPIAYGELLRTLAADQDLTGLQGLNAIRLVPSTEVEGFVARQRELLPTFEPQLAEDVDTHAILFRIHPQRGNAAALGFDVLDNPTAARAVRRSLRLDAARMTDALTLRQVPDRDDGLVVYTPTRVDGEVVGWVSVVMQGQSVMDAVSDGVDVRMTVVDQTPDRAVPIARANGGVEGATHQTLRSVTFYGQTWRVTVAPLSNDGSQIAWFVAGCGLLVTLMLAALVLTVGRSERRAIELAAERTSELGRANEELQRANAGLARAGRAKDDLVSAVSHELRTPLTIIRGFASTLARGSSELSRGAREALGMIDLHAQRLDGVVSDMLLTARLANGEETPTSSSVPVVSHVRAVVSQLPEVDDHEVVVTGPSGLMAVADVSHVSTMLGQLLSNATKYGAPPVAVDVVPVADRVEIRVSDAGTGLSAESAAELFGQFAQADSGDTRRSRGVGLGLWLVQQLAALNGGSAHFQQGERTTFVVSLPRVSAPMPSQPAAVDTGGAG